MLYVYIIYMSYMHAICMLKVHKKINLTIIFQSVHVYITTYFIEHT